MTAAARFEGWEVRLEGTVVNRSVEGEGVVDVSLTEKCGYDNFFKSRKKYKTLENITKKVEFKLDHRGHVYSLFSCHLPYPFLF